MDDLDGITSSQAQSGEGLDPLYQKFFDRAKEVGEADRVEQENTIPAGTYLFECTHFKGSINTWEGKKFVSAKVGAKVVEGAAAVGRYAFGDMGLTPSDQFWEGKGASRTHRDATPAEYEQNVDSFLKAQNKVARVLGLASPVPPQQTEASITAWGKPAIGKQFICDVRVKAGKDGVERNTFFWLSLAAPGEMTYKDKEKKQQKGTALEVLRAAIAKKAKKAGNGAASHKVGGGLD